MKRFSLVATISAGLIFGASCSKTQDTSPETRLFGSPPVINNVTLTQGGGAGQATCDISRIVEGYFCAAGYEMQTPPAITLTVTYSELQFTVQATDPDTPAGGQNDILLVAASYQRTNQGQPVETSLVMLDDGSTQAEPFQYSQQGDIKEACGNSMTDVCPFAGADVCLGAKYPLTSNDGVANDSTFSRGFALISNTMNLTAPTGFQLGSTKSSVAYNCVAREQKQFPAITDVPLGQPVAFKIEVVDRAGNLATWPTRPQADFQKTSVACAGDECGCCVLLSGDPVADCKHRPGMQGPPGTSHEAGWCMTELGP